MLQRVVASELPGYREYRDKNWSLVKFLDPDGKTPHVLHRPFVATANWRELLRLPPLAPKKKWAFTVNVFWRGKPATYAVDAEVKAIEDVTVKTGRLKAFKIQRSWDLRRRTNAP